MRWALWLVAPAILALPAPASADEAAWAALRSGGIALFRHAHAPGGGDPLGMRLGDCGSQRTLDDVGRAQARRIGQAFTTAGVTVGAVLSSEWCRTLETGELAFPGRVQAEPTFNSFFSDRSRGPAQTEAARRILAAWAGPGALVVSTHQVNITALTGIVPTSGEGIVVAVQGDAVRVVGRIRP